MAAYSWYGRILFTLQARIGNPKPGNQAKIVIAYVTEVKNENGAVRFYAPNTVAPRYVPEYAPRKKVMYFENTEFSE